MAKNLELCIHGTIRGEFVPDPSGVTVGRYDGETVDFNDLDTAAMWLQEHKNELTFIRVFWFCSDCESPNGGRLCRQCVIDAGLDPSLETKASYAAV